MNPTAINECFVFSGAWARYAESIADKSERMKYYLTITNYAFGYIDQPTELTGATLDFFNARIRPSLDKYRNTLAK